MFLEYGKCLWHMTTPAVEEKAGHCSLKAPEEVIDYIIIHELYHFKIKGHSHKFWDYLHKFVPDYEDHINWLAINGKYLIS